MAGRVLVAASAAAAFDALEPQCAAQYPQCGCATMPTQAEVDTTTKFVHRLLEPLEQ